MYTVEVDYAVAMYGCYFPRKFRYKDEAFRCAHEAKDAGCRGIRILLPSGTTQMICRCRPAPPGAEGTNIENGVLICDDCM